MTRLLLIETSTALTSVALVEDSKVVFYKDDAVSRNQSALTAPFIKEALDSAGISASQLDAVCVGMGPGSYTGLRVGVSSAKGLCFGSGVPLLAVGTLDILASEAIIRGAAEGCTRIVPLVDARRMEVYTAEYSPEGKRLTEVHAQIVGSDTFSGLLAEGPVLFVGDAADKCAPVIAQGATGDAPAAAMAVPSSVMAGPSSVMAGPDRPSPSAGPARFLQLYPSARGMVAPALAELAAGHFRDTAYFEPFYLKDFVATVSRKKLF